MFDSFNVSIKLPKEWPEQKPVEIDADNNGIVIRCGETKARITLTYDEFDIITKFIEEAKRLKPTI